MRQGPTGEEGGGLVGIEGTAANSITLDPRSCCPSFIRLGHRALYVRYTSSSDQIAALPRNDAMCHVWTAPAVQEENLTFPRIVRVQPCIRPLNAAVLAAGPDVIR